MARRRPQQVDGTLVLDSEGVAKAAANDRRVQAFLTSAYRRQARVIVSAATLTEVLRGTARDASIHHVLKRLTMRPLTEERGRDAGELIGSTGMPPSAAIDAMVAATALAEPAPVLLLTSDPDDLRALTEHRSDVAVQHV